MSTLLIAKITFRRLMRTQYLVAVGVLTIVSVLLFFANAKVAGDKIQVYQGSSIGLVIINLLLYFGCIWLAISILPGELNSKQMRMTYTKPVYPILIVFGHFLGAFAYLAAASLWLALVLTVCAAIKGGGLGLTIVWIVLHQLPVYSCFLALGFVLALWVNRPLAAFLLLPLGSEKFFKDWGIKGADLIQSEFYRLFNQMVSNVGYAIAPPISRMKLSLREFINFDFPFDKYLLILLYVVSYLILTHLAAAWLLKRKDL